jgi:hypothetical protein
VRSAFVVGDCCCAVMLLILFAVVILPFCSLLLILRRCIRMLLPDCGTLGCAAFYCCCIVAVRFRLVLIVVAGTVRCVTDVDCWFVRAIVAARDCCTFDYLCCLCVDLTLLQYLCLVLIVVIVDALLHIVIVRCCDIGFVLLMK